jgi:hypothetical protein
MFAVTAPEILSAAADANRDDVMAAKLSVEFLF